VLKSIDRRATGQRLLLESRIFSDNGFEQRIVPQQLSIIAVRVAGKNLINLLDENIFSRMSNAVLRSGIGQSASCFSENPELSIEFPDGQQSGIADNVSAIKSDGNELLSHFKKFQLARTLCLRHEEPPVRIK
jgi:hypothetical protein